jgi:cysteine desulfurase
MAYYSAGPPSGRNRPESATGTVKTVDMIYLDNNATTRIDPRVVRAMYECDCAGYANASSQHQAGRRTRRILETARDSIAEHLGCRVDGTRSDRVVFTSGGTESNNLALFGLAGDPPGRMLVSAIEHPSVVTAGQQLRKRGFEVELIPVTAEGVIRIDALNELLDRPARLVSVMLANNETGVLQPVREITEICHLAGCMVHTDAVQAVGKIPVDFCELRVDALSLSAHKFHGPRGIGALLVRGAAPLRPILYGGFQQQGLRPGTEPVTLAVGLQKALDLWQVESEQRFERMKSLRDRLEQALCTELPRAVVHGARAPRLPHTTCISLPGVDRQSLVMALDLAGLACSTGSACASGSSEPSPVLISMGCDSGLVEGAIRLSLGADTSAADIDEAARRICKVVKNLDR